MGFGVDCYQLEEKILVYSMFTRCYPAQGMTVLKEYIRQGGREQVILAYLTFESYGYFVGEKQVDPFLFEALEKITEKGWESDIICRLALLKNYAAENNWILTERNGGEDPSGMCRPAAEICLFPQSSKGASPVLPDGG